MAAVDEHLRIAELRRLGASAPLIQLASGECVREMFRYGCLGPPYFVYHNARTPDGPPFAALWDRNDTVVGVWEKPDGPEYIEFSIEDNGEYRSLARTEQGFWATQFNFCYENETPLEELREAAVAVGFRFLTQLVESRESAESRLGTTVGFDFWRRRLVADIDRLARET